MRPCNHFDTRKFPGVRACFSCGTATFKPSHRDNKTESSPSKASRSTWSYDYRSLNFELGQEVRLIVLQPGEGQQSIRCEIIHTNLDEDPEYAAVSYTWADENGNDSKSQLIFCLNGTIIPVTANCEAALRRIRHPGLKRRLWIDAICINQKDISERNHQVGIMDRIYSSASRVYAHIHDPEADHNMAMSWLRGAKEYPELEELLLMKVKALLSLRWFSRVWVIQEVALASSVIMLVNETSILLSFEVLQRLREYCNSHGLKVPGPLRWTKGPGDKCDLMTCLEASRDCSSNDPRDRIYAILSLVEPPVRKLIPIDYSQDLDWVNITVFIAAVTHYQNLDILSQAASASVASEPFSWIPQWTLLSARRKSIDQLMEVSRVPMLYTIDTMILDKRFERGHGAIPGKHSPGIMRILAPELSSSSPTPRLQVRAHHLDSIPASKSLISTINCVKFCENIYDDVSILQYYSWMLEFFRFSTLQDKNTLEELASRRQCSLEQLLHEDQASDEPYWSARHGGASGQFLASVSGSNMFTHGETHTGRSESIYNIKDLAEFLKDGMQWGEGRDIFQTTQSIGFASGNYREGDHVFAIDGAKAPFILRTIGKNQYRIVSDCYLWAAFDLTFWNSGTRKGRWANWTTDSPGEERTRTIELL